jgi:hypothetical protein
MTALTACGANGVLGLNPKPDGNIVLTNASTNALIVSSAASPFMVTSGGFSIGITENYFSGPYTVNVISWSAPFNIPCFVPHYISSTTKTNVVKFAEDNATPVTDLTQPSPCNPFVSNDKTQTDAETAQISDNDGHTINFYYKLSN